MFTTLKIQFKLIFERFINAFAQPKQGAVAPVDEKVKAAMEAPYKIESPTWPFPTEKPQLDQPVQTESKKRKPRKSSVKKTETAEKKPAAMKVAKKKE
jgi:hypothetical protein